MKKEDLITVYEAMETVVGGIKPKEDYKKLTAQRIFEISEELSLLDDEIAEMPENARSLYREILIEVKSENTPQATKNVAKKEPTKTSAKTAKTVKKDVPKKNIKTQKTTKTVAKKTTPKTKIPKAKKQVGPSNKELIYKSWLASKKTKMPKELVEEVDNRVKLSTVRTWVSQWHKNNPYFLPACSELKQKIKAEKAAAKKAEKAAAKQPETPTKKPVAKTTKKPVAKKSTKKPVAKKSTKK